MDEFVYIIMEYADGPTLMEVMRVGKIEVRQGAELAAEISDGLAAAHISGVVHRNVKPQNIFLDQQGRPHIADFGFRPPEGQLVGTLSYGTTPEWCLGREIDERSDIWSLGAIF